MKTETVIILVVAAAGALYLVTRKAATANAAAPGSVGAYGVQTHIPVASTGVALSSILGIVPSSWFGGGASSPAGIAPDPNTPILSSGVWGSPASTAPAVLPYSYKQQVVDTPALLGTDQLFTPPSDLYTNFNATDSSGGTYADQGGASDSSLSYDA